MWQKKNKIKRAPDWLRLELVMQSVMDPDCIINYMKNPHLAAGDMISEFNIIEQKGDDMKFYWRMKMPMMSERDNVASMKVTRLDGNRVFFQMTSIEHPDYPTRPNVVRMYQNITGYQRPHATLANTWDYCEIDQFDMKGHFPSRLFNMVLASSTKGEIEKMYHIIREQD